MKKSVALALVVGSGFFGGTAWAGTVTLPNTFTSGTPALAAEVNANFSAVKGAVDDNHTRLTAVEETVDSHTSSLLANTSFHANMSTAMQENSDRITAAETTISGHTNAITNNTNDLSYLNAAVATNTTNINNNSSAIDSNTAALATKQTRVFGTCANGNSIRVINADGSVVCQADTIGSGDITSVTAGSGLAGGGTTGDITLSIPISGITASHLGTGAVGSAAIADGSVASVDIADGAVASVDIADNSVTAADLANEAGINYGGTANITTTLSTCNTTTSLSAVSITVPSSGYIHVTASGSSCTYTGGVYSMLMLDDAPGGATLTWDNENYAYDYSSAARGCGIGQFIPYTFENVYYVAAPGYYTYYINGCVSIANNQTFFKSRPMVATFYPTRY